MNGAVEHIATDQPPDDTRARDLDYAWQPGNQVELLENGEAYFPKVFEALRQARQEILTGDTLFCSRTRSVMNCTGF